MNIKDIFRHQAKTSGAGSERGRAVIKLSDNTLHIVWADEYDRWMKYYTETGKIK
ncbi:MAG: hypothetical protein ACP5RM_01530 [Candidatus Micrarchaeia archaeon]